MGSATGSRGVVPAGRARGGTEMEDRVFERVLVSCARRWAGTDAMTAAAR